uniref:Uncharacterized protein n=1 Tax=Chromera velia CCMP2878 TaxID=1169474 RepID=A0A0G4G5L5_9ALVE|eukprot:Cvel_20314.t1-p1 / transcript=Cvel_20314.t1 / gene=Cvel_20314 / organism=Chromera_velia_CCMP2878 / gene_product=hypothetical protein / transcript_product=hypothetical protein / location=Cvel_scaffold1814:2997-4382(+) / protein_length=305 / sequence_SO=supercontig / SO=protein_coding / is_pseudo=false
MEEARVEHNRLGIHSGAEYFHLTLEEDGKSITAAMATEITATCRTCKKILTDRAPELIGGKFIETCRSFSPPILPERAPTGIKGILGFAERPIRTHQNQVSGQNHPAAHPQGGGAPPQISAIQEGAAAAQEDGGGAAGIGGDDQDLEVEVQAEVPQQGAGPPGDSQRKYTGLLVEANGRRLVMMQTGKAYHKSIPTVWLQPVGDGSGKWRAEGIAPNPIRKQQVLRYFDFVDDRLPAKIESQVSPGPPPIGVGLSTQQQGVVNEGVPPDVGGDAPAALHPDGIPPDDSLFGSDLLRNPQHEGGAE